MREGCMRGMYNFFNPVQTNLVQVQSYLSCLTVSSRPLALEIENKSRQRMRHCDVTLEHFSFQGLSFSLLGFIEGKIAFWAHVFFLPFAFCYSLSLKTRVAPVSWLVDCILTSAAVFPALHFWTGFLGWTFCGRKPSFVKTALCVQFCLTRTKENWCGLVISDDSCRVWPRLCPETTGIGSSSATTLSEGWTGIDSGEMEKQ